jgi:hypothetical protein
MPRKRPPTTHRRERVPLEKRTEIARASVPEGPEAVTDAAGAEPVADTEASMSGPDDHDACVAAWMKRAERLDPAQRWPFFEQALDALWQRAHRTLGDVTLMAIVGRVLHDAAQRAPLFGALTVEAHGFRCDARRERAGTADPRELAEGMRFVLVEYLTVLGSLTADILTPALHSELSNATRASGDRTRKSDAGTSRTEG